MGTITPPITLVQRVAELLSMIVTMQPGYEIYEYSKQLNIDLLEEIRKIRNK